MNPLHFFLVGATAIAYWIASVFFLRFWRDTHDRLFGLFAIAFLVLGVNRIFVGLASLSHEASAYVYLGRLLGYVLIAGAILDKNRRS